jgi:hypothetical protein
MGIYQSPLTVCMCLCLNNLPPVDPRLRNRSHRDRPEETFDQVQLLAARVIGLPGATVSPRMDAPTCGMITC